VSAADQPAHQRPERIVLLLRDNRLIEQRFSHRDITSVWQKAVSTASDARVPVLSVDSAIRLAYDAGHAAALALLNAHGLKTSSGRGHHELTFYAAAALAGDVLVDFVADSEEIRHLRHGSMYDPVIATERDRLSALAWLALVLPAVRSALVDLDATYAKTLAIPH
jgi:hypothetical protein